MSKEQKALNTDRQQFWQMVMEARKESGLSVAAFCKKVSSGALKSTTMGAFKGVFSASVYDMIFRGCYRIRRQQRYLMRTTYEEPIEIEFTGKACPWT